MNRSPARGSSGSPAQRPGGRVLGAPIPPRILSPALPSRSQILASPSESLVSLASQNSFSFDTGNDGGFRAQLSRDPPVEPERMTCPICEEDMVTLLQLNRHLDDAHREVEEVEKDDIQSWFKKRMMKAKQFQPVAALQKLKGLDVFESNEPVYAPQPTTYSNGSTPAPTPPPRERDPDEIVTKKHWQRSTGRDFCSDPACGKPLGTYNGNVNCRKCGRLFCEEHTMYQIKLSRSAQHEPVRGVWCRVCETCYSSREGYLDHRGFTRDHFDEFAQLRRKKIDRQHLETTRLEKRLTRLTQILTDPSAAETVIAKSNGSSLWPVTLKNQRKVLEQSVVSWEDDATVATCPFCKQTFTNFSLRKHHCRLCGRVVCGDTRTGCSKEVGLNVSTTSALTEKEVSEHSLDVRICRDCNSVVFSKRDFAKEVAARPPVVRSYDALIQFEKGIRSILPRFQKLLQILQNPDATPTPQQLAEAAKTRKKLLDSFTQYDTAAKRILKLPTDSAAEKQMQKAIYQMSVDFLHTHMLPLKSLPKLLKKRRPPMLNGADSPTGSRSSNIARHPTTRSMLSSMDDGTSSVASSMTEVDLEEKALKEQLAVLQEQKFFVGEMIASAKVGRRFDEVGTLAQSSQDLDNEITKVEADLRAFEIRNGM